MVKYRSDKATQNDTQRRQVNSKTWPLTKAKKNLLCTAKYFNVQQYIFDLVVCKYYCVKKHVIWSRKTEFSPGPSIIPVVTAQVQNRSI